MEERALRLLASELCLPLEVIIRLYTAPRLHLVLDDEGTITTIGKRPEGARPDGDLRALLAALTERPGTRVTLVSGRDPAALDRWAGALPVGRYAEDGRWRAGPDGRWGERGAVDGAWRRGLVALFERLAAEREGASVEVTERALALHHRAAAERATAAWFGALAGRVGPLLRGIGVLHVDEVAGRLEVRFAPPSRGVVVVDALAERAPREHVLVAGDGAADEAMFRALRGQGIALHVGPGPTAAPWSVVDSWALRRLLRALAPAARRAVGAA